MNALLVLAEMDVTAAIIIGGVLLAVLFAVLLLVLAYNLSLIHISEPTRPY